MIDRVKDYAEGELRDYEHSLMDKARTELENLLDDYVKSESHTNFVEQTKRFFENMFNQD